MKREQLSKIICDLDDRQIAEACRFDPALCKGSPGRKTSWRNLTGTEAKYF